MASSSFLLSSSPLLSFACPTRFPNDVALLARNCHRSRMSSTGFSKALYQREFEAAIDVVERACHLCAIVQQSITLNGEGRYSKSDLSPVTVADFGVQALVSMELGMLFPSISLVGEEDATHLRKELLICHEGDKVPLVDLVVEAVSSVGVSKLGPINNHTVLDAIDRGGDGYVGNDISDERKSIFWVLDPIDGTRGFLKGGDALYVVGLALVVEGKLVLGVMGCPNITHSKQGTSRTGKRILDSVCAAFKENCSSRMCENGFIMAAYSSGGCWVKPLQVRIMGESEAIMGLHDFARCSVHQCYSLEEAWFSVSDHEAWQSSPLGRALIAISVSGISGPFKEENVLSLCCGSLCKYFAVAIGSTSIVVLHRTPGTPVKVWDHAAGVICVAEAGGKVTDGKGTTLERLMGEGRTFTPELGVIVISNAHLHKKILDALYK